MRKKRGCETIDTNMVDTKVGMLIEELNRVIPVIEAIRQAERER